MTQRPRFAWIPFIALACCGGSGGVDPSRASQQAIVGGTAVDAPLSPVIYLQGPEGGCTAVLIAPTLAVTARHCVAASTTGPFSCTPAGDLVPNGSGAGEIGTDDSPASLAFFASSRAAQGSASAILPDAVGARILSTQTPTACRDDLAFVVLNQPIAGLEVAAVRINSGTRVGESVSVWGYGLTDQPQPLALRMRGGVAITGVGPDTALTTTQPAPVRCLRTGPVTCQGDSGGPMISEATGAVVGIVSLGSQAGAMGPYCGIAQSSDTIGPRLAAYRDLAMTAFVAAGASPIAEATIADAASEAEASNAPDGASEIDQADAPDAAADLDTPDASEVSTMPDAENESDADPGRESDAAFEAPPPTAPSGNASRYRAQGASCATAPEPDRVSKRQFLPALILAAAALAVGRRRRLRTHRARPRMIL